MIMKMQHGKPPAIHWLQKNLLIIAHINYLEKLGKTVYEEFD